MIFNTSLQLEHYIERDERSTFHLCFDETTTSKMAKQYDSIYDCSHFQRIAATYLGTLFVGKCTAEDLLHHLYEMLDTIHLKQDSIITVGLDGAIVKGCRYIFASWFCMSKTEHL